jgi:hypothetical protein
VKWLSEGWYICHNKQMQLWHVTFATEGLGTIVLLSFKNWTIILPRCYVYKMTRNLRSLVRKFPYPRYRTSCMP